MKRFLLILLVMTALLFVPAFCVYADEVDTPEGSEPVDPSVPPQLDASAARIGELEAVVAHYQNLKVIRIRAWIGRVLRKIKRCGCFFEYGRCKSSSFVH